jgi:hypothetical protein
MSAFVKAAKEEAESQAGSSDQVGQETAATYAKFVSSVHDVLTNRVDRLGHCHNIHFAAQDDDWETSAFGRSGIPLQTFAKKWEQLETRASTMDPSTFPNRDCDILLDRPATPVELASLTAGRFPSANHGPLRSRFGGAFPQARSLVRRLAVVYLASFPGSPSQPGNGRVNGYCADLVHNKDDFDWPWLEDIFMLLEYRLSAITTATEVLRAAQIPLPFGQECG